MHSTGRLCYVCSKPGHHIKKDCPKRVQPVCYFCNEQGHKYTDCLQRKTWQDSSAGLDEFERLCSIRKWQFFRMLSYVTIQILWTICFFPGILDNSGVKLTPPSNEFRDFKTFTAKIFKKYAQQCGAVCVTPQGIPDYSLKIGELAKEKVCPHIQEYEQHSEGRLLLRLYIKVKVIIVMFSNNSVQGSFWLRTKKINRVRTKTSWRNAKNLIPKKLWTFLDQPFFGTKCFVCSGEFFRKNGERRVSLPTCSTKIFHFFQRKPLLTGKYYYWCISF